MHGEQQFEGDWRDQNLLAQDSVRPAEDRDGRPTAEFQVSAARTNRKERGESIERAAILNPTPVPALDELTNIRVLTDTYNRRLDEFSRVSESNRRAGRSNTGLYREIAMLQMRLADLIREKEAKENPKPGPCEVLGYTMDEFMDRFGDMVRERRLRDLDDILRFLAPIRNPHLSSKKIGQAVFEITSQLTHGDELKDVWTASPL